MRTALILLRRFAVVCGLGLWIGGTTLYTGFVIRIGHRLIPGGKFGQVTRDVTGVLQIIGLITVGVLLVNLLADAKAGRPFVRWGSRATWLVCALTLAVQFALRSTMLGLMDSPARDRFESAHESYEMMTAIQWGAAMLHGGCVLASWRGADAATREAAG